MFEYIKGKIVSIKTSYVVLESNNIGYTIISPNPYYYKLGVESKIYLYQHVRENEMLLYGFSNLEEKQLFLRLIEVKGIGPKMALPLLATENPLMLIKAIEGEDIEYLKKFPKIGDKIARQIILDLKGKLVTKTEVKNEELEDALLVLGYKKGVINKVLPKVNKDLPLETQIKEALKLLLN